MINVITELINVIIIAINVITEVINVIIIAINWFYFY